MSDALALSHALSILNRYPYEGHKAGMGYRYVAAEHDELWVGGTDPDSMKPEDVAALEELYFHWDEDTESWHTFT